MAKAKQNALMRPVTPSGELAEITGKAPLPRTEVVKKGVGSHQEEQSSGSEEQA
jgi:hypothetical protein